MSQPRTFADVLVSPVTGRAELVRDFVMALAGSALIAVCAKIRIGGPVPFTMQSWAVILLGAALGSRRGALVVSAYLSEGFVGLPVFAGPVAGPAYLLGPTGGFLLGFLPAAIVVGWLAERKWDRHFFTAVIAVGIGDAIILTIGVCWLAYLSGFRSALSIGLRPLWIADLLKVLLAALALPGVWRLIGRGTRIP
jgi:biotin transport system substrate-specific component